MNLKRSGNIRAATKARRRFKKIASQCEGLEQRTLLSLAFGSSQSTNVFDLYRGIQTANINGDNNIDVVVGTRTGGSGQQLTGTAVLLSNGDGTFTPIASSPAMPASSGTVNPFVVGNFTQDSQADILYLTEDNSGGSTNGDLAITPEINNDDNPTTFTAGTVTDIPAQSGSSFDPLAAVSGHFTEDGNLDMAVLGAISGGTELVILEGNNTGTFEPIPQAPFTFPSDGFNGGDELVAGNFMGTSNPDIAIYDSTTGNTQIIQNLGTSTFQQVPPITLAPSTYTIDGSTIAAGDFNGDGVTDLAVADNIGTDAAIDIYLSNANGTFGSAMTASDGSPHPGTDFNGSIVTGDFDNDGKTDVADDFGVLLGNGDGTLQAPVAGLALGSANGVEFAAIAAGDFDGDQIPDLAGISLTGQGFEAALNTTPQTSTTTVTSPVNTTPLGQSVTFTATITISSTDGTPTGNVTFLDGTTPIGTAALASSDAVNTAQFMTSSLTAGVHSITASYSGDASFDASTSEPYSQTITESTSTALATANASANTGAIVTFTATVAPSTPGGAVPTGTVDFFQDGNDIGSSSLNGSGVATFGVTTLPVGQDDITATYSGDAAYATSTSSTVTQTINGQVADAADLVPAITGAKLPVAAVIGGKIRATVPVVITNQGHAAAKGKITLNVFLSTVPILDSTATMLFTQSHNVSIAAGKNTKISEAITSLPAALTQGTYYVLVQVLDPSGFGNTAASATTMAISTPFIALSDDITGFTSLSGTVTGDTTTKAIGSVELDNLGNVPAIGPVTIKLYFSSDLSLDSSDALINTLKTKVNIASGRFAVVKIPLKMIPNIPSGSYYILADVTDPKNQDSQAATFSQLTINAADVALSATVESVSPGTIKAGSTGTMTLSITNTGNVPSNSPLSIVLGLSNDGFSQSTILETVPQKVSIKVNGTITVHLKFTVLSTQAKAMYLPTVTVTDADSNSSGLIFGTTPLTIG